MRKVALLATTAIAAVGVTTPAWAVNADQGLDVSLSPTKAGTKQKPAAVKIKVKTTTNPKDNVPFATREAVIHFDKALVFNPKKFKTCSASKIQASESSCPKGSKVGSGSAIGTAIGQTSNLKVSAFNGPKSKLMLHVTASTPLQIDAVIQASLKKDKGKYGYKLVVPIPENLQQPVPGVFATLKQFVTSVKATSKGVPYVGLASCPKSKKLHFGGDFTFTDGTKLSATDTVKCKPGKKSKK
jgi:hypothetical protein